MERVCRCHIFICLALLCATLSGCGSSRSDAPFRIPAEYVSDTVVVPAELQQEYDDFQQAYNSFPYPDRDPRRVEDALTFPLSYRRAAIYAGYTGLKLNDGNVGTVDLICFPSTDGEHDELIAEIAQTANLRIEYQSYVGRDRNYNFYGLRANEALTVGETAWLADWIVSNYPEVFVHAQPIPLPG